MTNARRQSCDRLIGAPQRGVVFAAAALFIAAPSALRAQETWMPTVATSPGGVLNNEAVPGDLVPGHVGRTPSQIDPRFFPSPHSSTPVPRHMVPPGAWSPIVTGALPGADAPAAPAYVPPVEKREALSPVRPLKPVMAAAGDAKAPQSKKAGDAKAPAAGGEGQDAAGGAADSVFNKPPGPLDALPPDATPAQQYCFTTVETAQDSRFAWQANKIKEMEAELDKRAQQLEAKTQEYKQWLARRDEFSRKAQEKLVGFYARMRPDAAAVQLATVDEGMAAAVMMKLETKVASAIMNEMDPERAAKIASIISGAARVPPEKRRQAPPPPDTEEPEAPAAAAPPPPEEPKT